MIIIKNFKSCVEEIKNKKIIPKRTLNKLKGIDYDLGDFFLEICEFRNELNF
ncbi:MAG: hypothetical protein JXA99_09455 [Candidatus Lokiarchaeota archaeon]|nr:hypothetical protein [Candidatus Lokiarchaeota archaeon]